MRDPRRYIPSVFENKISATDLKKIQAGIRSAQIEAIRDVAYSIESVEFRNVVLKILENESNNQQQKV